MVVGLLYLCALGVVALVRGNEDLSLPWNTSWVDAYPLPAKGKWFERIIIFLFENHSFEEVSKDPSFNYYFSLGTEFKNYFAITHPSQPNYFTLVAGDYFKLNFDHNVDLPYSNLIDLFDKRKITWKGYMEDYPAKCAPDATIGKYYRKHNPFISFNNIRNNATRCSKLVNSDELDKDLAAGTLPQYMFFTPNIDNDAHNTNIKFAGEWLNKYLDPRIKKFPAGTLFVITWDEDDHTEENQIFTSMFGSMIKPKTIDSTKLSHYSLLRTVEENWDLGTLGRNDDTATTFFK